MFPLPFLLCLPTGMGCSLSHRSSLLLLLLQAASALWQEGGGRYDGAVAGARPGPRSPPELVSPPRCSHSALPTLLSILLSHRFVAPPSHLLCPFSLSRDTEWAGPKSLSQGKVPQAQALRRHRGFECTQALQGASLADTRAHSRAHRLGQKEERTKRSLTIPLFISTLVGWRLRLIHSG